MAIKSFLSEGGFSVGSVGSTPIEVIDSSGNVTAVGLTVSGNLIVNGSTTTINSTTTTLDDPIFTLGGDTAPTSDDNKDRGIEFRWHTGSLAKVGFFGYDDSTGKFVFIPDATNNSEVFAGTKGTLDANIEWADVLNKPDPVVTVTLTGDVTGTANATLTDLGNGTITVATTIAADSIALGTDTTGNYVASITNGSYITGGNGGSEGAALTLAVDATSANTASKVVARDASGNFSAGVITGTRLEARNSGATQIYLDSTTSGSKEIVFQNNGATAGYVWASGSYVGLGGGGAATSLFVTAASGNTGIGTTSPGGRLEVNFPVASGATALILRTSDGGANGTIRWQNSTAVNGAAIGSNYNVSDVGALEFLNGNTTNVIFRSSGNVGIGTTAPGQKLEVNGNILAGNSVANNSISVTRTGANSSSLSLQAFTDSPAITWDGAGGYLRFIYSSTEQMRITSGGNVGIGVTSPGAKLHVAGAHADEGADRAATTAFIVDTKTNGTGDGKTYIKTGWVNTGNYGVSTLAVGYYASGTQVRDVITMLGTGNVGIGVSAPVVPLEVKDAGAGNKVAHFGSGYVRIGGSIDNGSSTVLNVAPGVVAFDAPGVVGGRFTINSSGNVGIGNTSPSNKLDVTGAIRTTDWYYVDGSGFGMYNNATGLYLSTIGNNWDISSASGQTWSGLRLYSGGKNVTWRGHFYGDGTGQGFLDSAGNWALRVDSSKRLIAYSGIANMDAGIRVSMPGGAAYATTTSTITGAFKIKLPTARYKSDSMLRMTINIYQYSTGQSLKFNVGGYNYNHATNAWLNVFAEQESDSNATVYTVRFGDDGTSNCIWIGETNSTWSYPQVFVSDFQAGFGGTTADWASSWAITAVTAFDTVYTSRVSAIKVTSNNIGTYGVSSITGTANQITASASTGAVTLSLPQNIHTGATPTFSSLTLSGDVITLSGSGVSAYANSTARIYNQAGVGPTINGNSLEVRTGSSGTLALTVNSSQHSLFAGRASTGVFPGFTSAQLPQYGMGVAYGTDATSYAATGATRAPDGYTIAIGPFNNTNRYSQIVFGVGNGGVNGFSYIGGAAHGTSYLAHLIFGRTTGSASYAESMRIDGSSGNVLIGGVIDGGQKLQVNGTGYFAGSVQSRAAAASFVAANYDYTGDYSLASTVGSLIGSNSTSASLRIAVLGSDTTSDPFVNFLTAGATNWSVGVDNSDSDSFKITNTTGVGSNEKLTITTAGAATFAAGITVNSSITSGAGSLSLNGASGNGVIINNSLTGGVNIGAVPTQVGILSVRPVADGIFNFRNAASLGSYTGGAIDMLNDATNTVTNLTFRAAAYNFLTGAATFAGAVTFNGATTHSGSATFNSGARIIPDGGSASATGVGFTAGNGFFYTGSNIVRIAAAGVEAATFSATAATFAGAVTVAGNLTITASGKQTLGQSVNATVYAGNSTTLDQAIILSNTRRANYGDVMIAKNLEGVASTDSYATPGTTVATGYAAVEMRYGGAVRVYGNSGATTAAATVSPNVLAEFTPTSVALNQNTSVTGNLTVSGNLIINGTTTTVNSTVSTIKDPIVTLGGGDAGTAAASDDNKDRGIEFKWHNGTAAKTGFFGFDDSTGYFTFIPDATNTSEVFSGTQGDIQASNFRGNLIGNVTGNVSGSAGSVATLTAGSYLTGTSSSFNGSTAVTFAVDATSANTVSKVVARDASGNFSAGTITAALSGNASTSSDSSLLNGISAINLYNNMGEGHGQRTSFDATTPSYGFGYRYVQGSTNGPGTGGGVSGQFYSWYIGLGSQYPATGANSHGAMFAVDRNSATPYLSVRFNESNAFGSWYKIRAGAADSWSTARTLTIGSTGKSVNGSADVAWTASEIGTSANTASTIVARDASGSFSAGASNFIGPATTTAYALRVAKGNAADTGGHTTFLGMACETTSWSKGAIGWTRTGSYDTGQLGFFINTAVDATSAATSDLKMVILGNGNVGIGLAFGTAPSYKLEVSGTGYFSGALSSGGTITSSGNLTVTGGTITGGASGLSLAAGGTNQNITLTSSGTGRIDIVGPANAIAARIGAASQYLTVGSYTPNSAGATLGYNGTQYLGLNAFFGVLVGRTYVSNNTTAPADGMIIQGNVGIGTTSPSAKLDISGNSVQDVGLVRFINDSTSGTFVPTASFIQTRGNHSYGTVAEFRVNTAGDTDRPTILFRSAQAAHQWRVGQVTSGWGTNDNFGIGYVASNASPVAWPTNYFTITTGGNVGIGVTGPSYKLEVNGSFAATTKSFVIKHPTKEGKKLRYGSLEGPENGVYVRGKLKGSNVIELPDYWTKLIDPESITVQLTPIGSHQKLYVEKIEDNKVYIANENLLAKAINCFFYVLAERIDVEKLQVEIDA